MYITTEDANDIPVRVCLGFWRVSSAARGKNPGNLRLSGHCSRPRVPCDRKPRLAERRAADEDDTDDVLARLLALQASGDVDDELIRRTLAGLVVGMIETTSQAAIQALLVLFSMPDALAKAAAAANADDDD